MRIWISGPRIFGGLLRPGIGFSLPPWRSASAAALGDSCYVIQGAHGLCKIGMSANPAARLATLQTGSPHRLWLAFQAPAGGHALEIEQEAHSILSAHRAGGEWFLASPEMAIAAIYAASARLGYPLAAGQPSRKRFGISAGWLVALAFAAWYALYVWHQATCGYYCG